jgi:hypothetical protein
MVDGHPRIYPVWCYYWVNEGYNDTFWVDWEKSCPYPFYGYPPSDVCSLSDNFPIPVKNQGPPDDCRQAKQAVGNPINSGTGNKFQTEVDYQETSPFPLGVAQK